MDKINKNMMRVSALAIIIIAMLFGPAHATAATKIDSTPTLSGTVGNYPVKMKLTFYNNGTVTGWYYYVSKGSKHKINLKGSYSGSMGSAIVNLSETVNGVVSGYYSGEYKSFLDNSTKKYIYYYYGKWTGAGGMQMPFEIKNF